MALVQNPIIGRARNKFGNAIFSTWRGKNTLRTKPLEVANPNTILQQRNRLRLRYLSERAAQFQKTISFVFASVAIGVTERNVFTSRNYPNFSDLPDTSPAAVSFQLGQLKLSLENAPANTITSVSSTGFEIDISAIPAAERPNWVFVRYTFDNVLSDRNWGNYFSREERENQSGTIVTFTIPAPQAWIVVAYNKITRRSTQIAENI